MSASDRHELKLRGLVESAGFELAVSLDHVGMFRIITKDDWKTVASAAVTSAGFRVFFPEERRQVSTATDLVDVLEQIKAAA